MTNDLLTAAWTKKATRARRQIRALLAAMLALIVALSVAGVTIYRLTTADRDQAQAVAASEQSQKQEIAQEARAVICRADDVEVYDDALCARLEAVSQEPSPAAAGPKGDKGDSGRDGRDGKDSTVSGPAGPAGRDGADGRNGLDSLIAGPQGAAGLDSLVPGPTGPIGPAGPAGPAGNDGKDGLNGADGAPGRDVISVTCEGADDTSYWLVTYSDGTSQTSSGPCRLTTLPPTTEAP